MTRSPLCITERRRTRVAAPLATLSIVATLLLAGTPASGSSPSNAPSESPGRHWTYVALGDSSGYGAADCGGCTPYPVVLAERITADTGIPVELHNLTQHNSLTTTVLLQQIRANAVIGTDPSLPRDAGEMASGAAAQEPVRDAIAGADIITIDVGFNDVLAALGGPPDYGCGGTFDATCIESVVTPIAANIEAIMAEIDLLRDGRPTMVRILGGSDGWTDDVGVAPEVNAARAEGTLALVRAQDAAYCSIATAHHALCVDMFHIFNGPAGSLPQDMSYVDPQGGHPNQKGQDAYAAAIAALGYAPLD